MELIRTMFQPKTSMSPAKSIDTSNVLSSSTILTPSSSSAKKRKHIPEPSPIRLTNGDRAHELGASPKPAKMVNHGQAHGSPTGKGGPGGEKRQGFTFDEVKGLLDNLLGQDKKILDSSVNVGIKNIDLSGCVVEGHEADECKQLVDKLVHNTRRIRTLEEVLNEIKSSLGKRVYTDIILQSGKGSPPKRPPSAYLMYHRKRFKELQEEGETLASSIAKKVSEEWKNLDEQERNRYMKQHDREVKAYEESIKRMGLVKTKKPVRPKSAKLMFIRSKMAELGAKLPKDKSKLDKLKKKLGDEFDASESDIKEYWISIHDAERKRYVQQREKFIQDNPHLNRDDIIKPRQPRLKVKPPVRPKNAMKIFIEKKIPEDLEGQERKDTIARLREKFGQLSMKRQLKYIKKAVRDKERYEEELEEFTRDHPHVKVPSHKPNVTKGQWRIYEALAHIDEE